MTNDLGEVFLDFRAPPTLVRGVTFKQTLSPSWNTTIFVLLNSSFLF